jgi:hypothetical protein
MLVLSKISSNLEIKHNTCTIALLIAKWIWVRVLICYYVILLYHIILYIIIYIILYTLLHIIILYYIMYYVTNL